MFPQGSRKKLADDRRCSPDNMTVIKCAIKGEARVRFSTPGVLPAKIAERKPADSDTQWGNGGGQRRAVPATSVGPVAAGRGNQSGWLPFSIDG